MQPQLIRIPQVLKQTCLTRSAVYVLVASGEFPPQIKLSKDGRAVAWIQSEVDSWIESRISARDAKGAA